MKRSNVLQGYLLRSTAKQELEGRCTEVSQMKAVKMHIQEEAIWKDNHLIAADPSQRTGILSIGASAPTSPQWHTKPKAVTHPPSQHLCASRRKSEEQEEHSHTTGFTGWCRGVSTLPSPEAAAPGTASSACWASGEPQCITVQHCWKDLMGCSWRSLAQHCPPTAGACLHGKAAVKRNVLWHKQVQEHQLQLHYIRMHQLWILLLWSSGVTLATKLKSVYVDKAFHLYPQNGARLRHTTFWLLTEKKPQKSFHEHQNSKFIHK